jgi:hypothetical protein
MIDIMVMINPQTVKVLGWNFSFTKILVMGFNNWINPFLSQSGKKLAIDSILSFND